MAKPSPLDDIRSGFEFFEVWQDKYRFLIDIGKQVGVLPPPARNEAKHPISVYADAARRAGYIVEDEKVLDTVANTRNGGN